MPGPRSTGARRLSAFFQGAAEPAFLLDAGHRLVYVNPAWEALTGQSAEAVAGLVCRPHGPGRDGDLEGIGGAFCPPPEAVSGRPSGQKTLIVHSEGERLWRRVEYWPWHDGTGALIGLLGVVSPADAPAHAPEAESQQLRAELAEVRERLRARKGLDVMIGRGPAHRRLLDQVSAAAAAEAAVLIVGEPGSGKRTVARAIHARGPRSASPLIPFDCSALPPEVLARGLFGQDRRADRLDLPEGATLLLFDAVDVARDVQARLVEAIESSRVRLLATTSVDPEAARREGRLREDLYYLLTGLVIRLDPLRDRLDDLPILAQHFLERANLRGDRRRSSLSPEAIMTLQAYDWPGNLRELARVIEASHARGESDILQAADLPASIRGHLASAYLPPPIPSKVTPLDATLEQIERRLIEQALQKARQNKSRAAELLGISRPRLYRRIKELGIRDEPEPADEAEPVASNGAGGLTGLPGDRPIG